MGATPEPLLPIEPPRRVPLKIKLLIGGGLLLVTGAVGMVFLFSSGAPKPEETPSESIRPAPPASAAKAPPGPSRTKPANNEERAAEELYRSAEALERANPGDLEKVMRRYLQVFQSHPTTGWGKKADERYRELDRSAQAALDREFQAARKDAQALASAGHFRDAIETMRKYLQSQAKEPSRRPAESEIIVLENRSRDAFNKVAPEAAELSKKGDHAGAIGLFEKLKEGAIPEVALRCEAAIVELRDAAKAYAAAAVLAQAEAARKVFREGAGSKLVALQKSRRYEEALKEFDAAAQEESLATLRDELSRERSGLAQAAAFWEAFLKSLRARLNQETSVTLSGAKDKAARVTGKLLRVDADRASIETAEGPAEAPLEKIDLDQVVAWTIGKTLPADDAATYVKAAFFFFGERRDDLARLYLATAKEMGANIAEAERVFREGLLRAAPKK